MAELLDFLLGAGKVVERRFDVKTEGEKLLREYLAEERKMGWEREKAYLPYGMPKAGVGYKPRTLEELLKVKEAGRMVITPYQEATLEVKEKEQKRKRNEAIIKRYEGGKEEIRKPLGPAYTKALKEEYGIIAPPPKPWTGEAAPRWYERLWPGAQKRQKAVVAKRQNIDDLRRLRDEGVITTRQQAIEALQRVGAITKTDIRGYEVILGEFPWGR